MYRLACEARQSGLEPLEPVDVSGLCLRREPVKRYVFTDGVDTLGYKDGYTTQSMSYRSLAGALQHKPGFEAAVGTVMQRQRRVHRQGELPRNREAQPGTASSAVT